MNEKVSRKLNILFVAVDKYPPFRVDVKVLFGKEFLSRGHTIDWIMQVADSKNWSGDTHWGDGVVLLGKNDSGKTVISKLRKHMYDLMNDLRVFIQVWKKPYDFVQVKDKVLVGMFALVAARMAGRKYFYWLSFPFPEMLLIRANSGNTRFPLITRFRGHLTKWLLYKFVLRFADHIFVQSDRMKHDVSLEDIKEEKMTVVPMGVDLSAVNSIDRAREELPTLESQPTILYLGILTKDRHLEFMVNVLSIVREQVPSVRLLFVGAGESEADEQLILDRASQLGLENDVVITGFLPIEEAWKYVIKADVCVSPFRPSPILDSTSPTKLIEYMVFNKPVVANDHPDQSQVLSESGAGYCVPYDEGEFAKAIIKLLQNPEDAKKIGSRGREYVEKHRSYKKISMDLERKYMELLDCQ